MLLISGACLALAEASGECIDGIINDTQKADVVSPAIGYEAEEEFKEFRKGRHGVEPIFSRKNGITASS